MKLIEEQAVALAGIFQVASLVDELANRGRTDTDAIKSSLYHQLAQPDREKMNITGYVLALFQLAGKLLKDRERISRLREGLRLAEEKLELYEIGHPNQDAVLADLYSEVISSLSPRIMVKGQPLYLQNPDTQRRIRALLLAGIRSAVLWKQLGGNRFLLVFQRKRLLSVVKELMLQA